MTRKRQAVFMSGGARLRAVGLTRKRGEVAGRAAKSFTGSAREKWVSASLIAVEGLDLCGGGCARRSAAADLVVVLRGVERGLAQAEPRPIYQRSDILSISK